MKQTHRIAILGTGVLAEALGRLWSLRHPVVFIGRSPERAQALADRIPGASWCQPDGGAASGDVVVIAVPLSAVSPMVDALGGPRGHLEGKVVIDCTNAVLYGQFDHLLPDGSGAELVARHAPGARVVKALHLFAGTSWQGLAATNRPVVAICGDDAGALDVTAQLVSELGGRAVVVGQLAAARQLEDVAGFVMRLVAAGVNPRDAVPDVKVS